jgi:hypothetical protein
MSKSLRQNFEQLLAELPAFRKDLGKLVQVAGEEQPGLKDALNQLLKGFDESIAETKQTMPQALAGVEKGVAGLNPGLDELRKSIAAAEQSLAATPAAAAAVPMPVPLPAGHGQKLRAELLERFAAPQAPARPVPVAGDVHDLTSGDWKDVVPERQPPNPVQAKPRTGIQPPARKPPDDDVGDMHSQDWR